MTVYNDQAAVTRTGSVQVPAGDSILILGGVPAVILPDSVNARGKATGKVSIGSVEVRQVSFDPGEVDRRRAEIAAQLRVLDDEIASVDVRLASFAARREFITKLVQSVGGSGPAPADAAARPRLADDPTAWRAASAAIGAETQDAGEAARIAGIERRDLAARRQALDARLAQLGRPQQGALEFAVSINAETPATIELSVTYRLRGAGWRP